MGLGPHTGGGKEGEWIFLEGQGPLQRPASKTVVLRELFQILGLKLS